MLESGLSIAPEQLAGLVPDTYARFRQIVADGITSFVSRLSPSRVQEIVAAQSALPVEADVRQRVVQLLHASPALHKIGQVVARRRELDVGLRSQLEQLESMEPHTPVEHVRPVVERELLPFAEQYRIELGDESLAEASVAVVLPLCWTEPRTGERQDAVAKVLKPGVVERMREDLDILGGLADVLDRRVGGERLPPLAYREIFDEVRDLLENEVRFDEEQSHLRLAGAQYANDPDVLVPGVLPFSTSAVTSMERVVGRKVTDLARRHRSHDRRLFATIVRALLADVILTRDERVLVHGDPHAGNLFVTDDGRLAPLDWSLAGTLSNAQREALAQLQLGAMFMDEPRMLRALEHLSAARLDATLVRRRIRAALDQRPALPLPGLRWVVHLMDDLALAGVRFRPNLMLFRKSFFTLEGVLADVCPEAVVEEALSAAAVRRFSLEWPLRWLKPASSPDYDTHISTADLLALGLSAPANYLRHALRMAG